MYKIKIKEKSRLEIIKNKYYADTLEITNEYVGKVLNGKLPVKAPIAKGIISILYSIPINDDKMQELLEKHFTKVS